MVQELVPGDGAAQLSFAALCADGEVLASLTARRVRQYPMDFGRAEQLRRDDRGPGPGARRASASRGNALHGAGRGGVQARRAHAARTCCSTSIRARGAGSRCAAARAWTSRICCGAWPPAQSCRRCARAPGVRWVRDGDRPARGRGRAARRPAVGSRLPAVAAAAARVRRVRAATIRCRRWSARCSRRGSSRAGCLAGGRSRGQRVADRDARRRAPLVEVDWTRRRPPLDRSSAGRRRPVFHHPAWLRAAARDVPLRAAALLRGAATTAGSSRACRWPTVVEPPHRPAAGRAAVLRPLPAARRAARRPRARRALLREALGDLQARARAAARGARDRRGASRRARRASGSTTTCSRSSPTWRGRAPLRQAAGAARRAPRAARGPACREWRTDRAALRGVLPPARRDAAPARRADAAAPVHPRPRGAVRARPRLRAARRARATAGRAAVFLTLRRHAHSTSTARPTRARSRLARTTCCSWRRSAGAASNGFRSLDFGRTHWGQEGLRAFKLAWGAEERELRYRHLGRPSPGRATPRRERAGRGDPAQPAGGEPADRRGAVPPCRLTRCAASPGRC